MRGHSTISNLQPDAEGCVSAPGGGWSWQLERQRDESNRMRGTGTSWCQRAGRKVRTEVGCGDWRSRAQVRMPTRKEGGRQARAPAQPITEAHRGARDSLAKESHIAPAARTRLTLLIAIWLSRKTDTSDARNGDTLAAENLKHVVAGGDLRGNVGLDRSRSGPQWSLGRCADEVRFAKVDATRKFETEGTGGTGIAGPEFAERLGIRAESRTRGVSSDARLDV